LAEAKILVVDDEQSILDLVTAYLKPEGYQVYTAMDGPAALKAARAFRPDLIVLDIMLPGMDGFEVLSQLRRESPVYVILLTARAEETDKIVGLSVGADDYLTKPFSADELLARLRVALRHAARWDGSREESIVAAGPITIDLARHEVRRDGDEVRLTATEFRLLAYLAANANRVLTHRGILSQVWGPQEGEHVEYLRVYIRQLRKKLEPDPERPAFLVTEPGVGYRFLADD